MSITSGAADWASPKTAHWPYLGVSYDWSDDEQTAEAYLQFLDASDPSDVKLVENGRFNGFRSLFREYLDYYGGYYYGGIEMPMDDMAVAPTMRAQMMPYYDSYYSSGLPKPARLVSRGDKIYIPHCESAGRDGSGRPMLACFSVMFDAAEPWAPIRQGSVNVPGEIVGVSDDGRILYTRDRQWEEDEDGCFYYTYWINVLSLGSEGAEIVKSFELENSWGSYYYYGCDDDDVADGDESSGLVPDSTSSNNTEIEDDAEVSRSL